MGAHCRVWACLICSLLLKTVLSDPYVDVAPVGMRYAFFMRRRHTHSPPPISQARRKTARDSISGIRTISFGCTHPRRLYTHRALPT